MESSLKGRCQLQMINQKKTSYKILYLLKVFFVFFEDANICLVLIKLAEFQLYLAV